MPELIFLRDGEILMRAPLRPERVVVGRAPECGLVVPDRAVSRRQCEIAPQGGAFLLSDLSGRGTQVGSRTAGPAGVALRDGDELRLGAWTVLYSAREAPRADRASTTPVRRTPVTKRQSTSSSAGPAVLRLRGDDGDTTAALAPDEGFRIVLGSDPQAPRSLQVPDTFASAEHCRISFRRGRWILSDLGSSNGTYVDGVHVLECVLAGSMAIRLGETTVVFEQGDSALGAQEPLPGLVSCDPAMAPVVDLVRRVAKSRAPVAIHGETGTGKEVVAHALHLLSERRAGPFTPLNCGAIARDTVESELFGHEKGAFTGAERARPGAFEEASGGTLFLDEVGDLASGVQVKLLRALERGEVRRLGASRTLQLDVRVVSATHRDLRTEVGEGSFREDLYYRLCVVPVELPPLRRRVRDIVPLAEHFLAQMAPGAGVTLSPGARARLESHPWPGNARELRNVVQIALLLRGGGVVTEDELRFRPAPPRRADPPLHLAGMTLDRVEREAYRMALERHGGDRRAVMDELGVARSTFFRKLEEFGLGREEDR